MAKHFDADFFFKELEKAASHLPEEEARKLREAGDMTKAAIKRRAGLPLDEKEAELYAKFRASLSPEEIAYYEEKP